jgi:hypothetical protein
MISRNKSKYQFSPTLSEVELFFPHFFANSQWAAVSTPFIVTERGGLVSSSSSLTWVSSSDVVGHRVLVEESSRDDPSWGQRL